MTLYERWSQPMSQTKAWICALINVLASPGLGTLLARRLVVGTIQLTFAIIGCLLVMGWFVQKMRLLYGQMFGTTIPLDAGNQLGKWGVIFFGIAWLWALISSIQIVLSAPKSSPVPPKIV